MKRIDHLHPESSELPDLERKEVVSLHYSSPLTDLVLHPGNPISTTVSLSEYSVITLATLVITQPQMPGLTLLQEYQ